MCLLRCWSHSQNTLANTQHVNCRWNAITDTIVCSVVFLSVFIYPVDRMDEFAKIEKEPNAIWFNPNHSYASGTPPWMPFLMAINSFMHLTNRTMNLPLSSPSAMGLRVALVLIRGMGEYRIIGLLMGQPLMAIAAQVGGVVFGHLLEMQQRTNVLILMRLSQVRERGWRTPSTSLAPPASAV